MSTTNQAKAHALQNKIATSGTEALSDDELTQLTQLLSSISLSSTKEGSQLREPRVNDPRPFNGSNHDGDGYNKLENFITQLKMVFILQPSRFPNEATKVMYAASFMDGMAFEWIQPYINNIGTAKEDPVATNFEQFTAAIRRMFGDVTLLSDAENKVMKMKQGNRSAAEYTTDFKRYAGLTNFNEHALLWAYKENINSQLQDELIIRQDVPTTLIEFQDLVINLDMLFRERNKKKGNQQRRINNLTRPVPNIINQQNRIPTHHPHQQHSFPQIHKENNDDDDVRPMEIDNATKKKKYAPLSKAEKQRRRDLNLCSYCGSPDHDVIECDLTPPRKSQSINANSILHEHPPTKGNCNVFTFEDFLLTQSK
ncbi:hypothetical protein G6F42_012532 [Rhizopus arrhizus]|nr:hypothetical protein G6F42_012532 [Rhizopus arrhizus]